MEANGNINRSTLINICAWLTGEVLRKPPLRQAAKRYVAF